MLELNIHAAHPSWHAILRDALAQLDPAYLAKLQQDDAWLPGPKQCFNAFSQPLDKIQTVLLGESPYPREASANGYAFWDAAVDAIWSEKGLSKPVNRATSLRNFIKMLLITEGRLSPEDTSQAAIAALEKGEFVQTLADLFQNLMQQGFLLLNTTLCLSDRAVPKDVRAWRPFIEHVLAALYQHRPDATLLLFGNMAKELSKIPVVSQFNTLQAEHPYNISFIHNASVQKFFQPLRALQAAL
ncbi:MAG: uracil-DNA glycosylase [marine bacterium B5-7]|nr:MAG: uracil-DNA glycosylase [marine bacterium B5-7]